MEELEKRKAEALESIAESLSVAVDTMTEKGEPSFLDVRIMDCIRVSGEPTEKPIQIEVTDDNTVM